MKNEGILTIRISRSYTLIIHSTIFIFDLFQSDHRRKPAGSFLSTVGEKFVRAAPGADAGDFDILLRHPGGHQLTGTDGPEIETVL
jgi:hypothetical protein